MDEEDKYLMLYCDNMQCSVNTFEQGDGSEHVYVKTPGRCPGCGRVGEALR